MIVAASVALAITAYIVPILVVFFAQARRDRTLSEIALDIPLAVAADLLTILLVTLVMRLETAIFVSRALWLGGGGAFLWRRWRAGHLHYPSTLRVRELVPVLGAALLVVLVCSPLSGDYFIWDSEWHTGLVGVLPSQRLPFHNALSQRDVFHYHFTGDVLAAVLKVLSFHVMSANRALAAAHDVMFALTGSTIALLVRGQGRLRGWPIALAGFGVLLHGPVPLRDGLGYQFFGVAHHSFLMLGYRPHYSVGILLLTGAVACVLTTILGSHDAHGKRTIPVLMVVLAAMSITDESSVALFGVFLGMMWLVYPRVIAEKRLHGFLVLLSLPLLMLTTNLLFSAALAPGSAVQRIDITPTWLIGGPLGGNGFLLFDTPDGRRAFLWDFLPLTAGWLALAVHAVRNPKRVLFALVAACGLLLPTIALLTLRVSINGDHSEVHRFFVAPFAILALCGVTCFGSMRAGSTERALVILGVFVPAASQIFWLRRVGPDFLKPWAASPNDAENIFITNCRTAAGARMGQTPRTAYVESPEFFRFTGCRPTYATGRGYGSWTTKIQPNIDWRVQLTELEGELPARSHPLDAVCRAGVHPRDPVCEHVRKNERACNREGNDYLRCTLTVADRNALLGR